MMGSSASSKRELRERLQARRHQLSPESRHAKSIRAAERMPSLGAAETVAVYSAIRSELDLRPVLDKLAQLGARVVYPRVVAGTMVLDFCVIDSPSDLALSGFGILEPLPALPALPLGEIDVFFVPALSFDPLGNRLGWGKGYYDYTLAQNPRALRVGFCFQEQITAALPTEGTDQSMDWVVTDAELFTGRARASLGLPKEPA